MSFLIKSVCGSLLFYFWQFSFVGFLVKFTTSSVLLFPNLSTNLLLFLYLQNSTLCDHITDSHLILWSETSEFTFPYSSLFLCRVLLKPWFARCWTCTSYGYFQAYELFVAFLVSTHTNKSISVHIFLKFGKHLFLSFDF